MNAASTRTAETSQTTATGTSVIINSSLSGTTLARLTAGTAAGRFPAEYVHE